MWHGGGDADAIMFLVHDTSYSSRIVVGDTYNDVIYATRGTAYMCAGLVAAVLGDNGLGLGGAGARAGRSAPVANGPNRPCGPEIGQDLGAVLPS